MESAHGRHVSGSQGAFALVLAIAAFILSLFLWADAGPIRCRTRHVRPASPGPPPRLARTEPYHLVSLPGLALPRKVG